MKKYQKYISEGLIGYQKDVEKDFSAEEIDQLVKILFDIWPKQANEDDKKLLHKLMRFFMVFQK
jgi:hypothetical protein